MVRRISNKQIIEKLEQIDKHLLENEAITHEEILNQIMEIHEENKVTEKKTEFYHYLSLIFVLFSLALPFVLDKTYLIIGIILYGAGICVFLVGIFVTPWSTLRGKRRG